eukprot:c30579_g1_i1 orf=2-181(-)
MPLKDHVPKKASQFAVMIVSMNGVKNAQFAIVNVCETHDVVMQTLMWPVKHIMQTLASPH